MPKQVITQHEVDAAAELVSSGKSRQSSLVQQVIGGSFSTVKRMLDVWQASQVAVPRVEIPDSISMRGAELLRLVWVEAQQLLDARVREVQDAALRDRELMQAELEEAIQTIARLELLTPLYNWFLRPFGDPELIESQHSLPEQVKIRSTVALALQQFQAVDMAFDWAVRMWQC